MIIIYLSLRLIYKHINNMNFFLNLTKKKESKTKASQNSGKNPSKDSNTFLPTTSTGKNLKNKKQATKKIDYSSLQLDDFHLNMLIKQSSFFKLLQVTHKSNKKPYTLKAIPKEPLLLPQNSALSSQINLEIELSQTLKHPNLVTTYTSFQDNDNLYLLQEPYSVEGFMNMETAYTQKNVRFEETYCSHFTSKLINLIIYLQNKGITLKNLSTSSLVLHPQTLEIKLVDFWMADSKKVKNGFKAEREECRAPEVLNNNLTTQKLDSWQLGLIIFEICSGHKLFGDSKKNTKEEISKRILDSKFDVEDHIKNFKISELCRNIIVDLLDRDPMERMDVEDIIYSDWLQDNLEKIEIILERKKKIRKKKEEKVDDILSDKKKNRKNKGKLMTTILSAASKDLSKTFNFVMNRIKRSTRETAELEQEMDDNQKEILQLQRELEILKRSKKKMSRKTSLPVNLRHVDSPDFVGDGKEEEEEEESEEFDGGHEEEDKKDVVVNEEQIPEKQKVEDLPQELTSIDLDFNDPNNTPSY